MLQATSSNTSTTIETSIETPSTAVSVTIPSSNAPSAVSTITSAGTKESASPTPGSNQTDTSNNSGVQPILANVLMTFALLLLHFAHYVR
ncbi:hypothetical protein CHS0354_014896 [Potamilus streckersoni]|uniref:Uncharacterized protein n=1 Tax=Potamilus streckersoni TaxID=2493646 RepID=A0AAE0SAH8_9BIVA|nr:hypothetical protein CHS0354_014896 [Potamilus streckersoni]